MRTTKNREEEVSRHENAAFNTHLAQRMRPRGPIGPKTAKNGKLGDFGAARFGPGGAQVRERQNWGPGACGPRKIARKRFRGTRTRLLTVIWAKECAREVRLARKRRKTGKSKILRRPGRGLGPTNQPICIDKYSTPRLIVLLLYLFLQPQPTQY